MKWIAGSIVLLAVVVAVVGWRATTQHSQRPPDTVIVRSPYTETTSPYLDQSRLP
jgi:hypothetical protein